MLVADALQHGRFAPDRAVSIGLQVAHAIASMHRKELLRLSLSPRELELGPNGDLLDIAPSGRVASEYHAPEQLEGLRTDRRTDVYLIGGLLHHMVTGRKAKAGQWPPSTSQNDDGVFEIFVIIERCMDPNADDRYPDMESVVTDLEAVRRMLGTLSQAVPLQTRPLATTIDLPPAGKSASVSSSGVMLTLILCLAGTVAFWWMVLR